MRVLVVNAHGVDLTAGGTERYVADLVSGLAERGYDVQVLSAFPPREDMRLSRTLVLHKSDWRDNQLRRIYNHTGSLLSIPLGRLESAVASTRADLVHTNNLQGITTAVWETTRRLGLPVVHTLHDYYLLCPRVSLQRPDGTPCRPHPLLCGLRTRRLGRWAGAVSEVIAGSEHLWQQHRELFPQARPHRLRLPLVPISERPLASPRTPPRTVGYLGALERAKGVESLLAAAPALAELGCTLRIAGDGRLRGAVEAATSKTLHYVGHVRGPAKLEFIEMTDIAIVPSRWAEPAGPPYVVCEWLAAGRPVLASDRGGLAEVQQLPGVLSVEPEAGGIVEAVSRLLRKETWHEVLGRLSQVEDTGDKQRWLDEHEAVYRAAASRVPLSRAPLDARVPDDLTPGVQPAAPSRRGTQPRS